MPDRPSFGCRKNAQPGIGVVGSDGVHDQQVDLVHRQPGIFHRGPTGRNCQVRRPHVRFRVMTALDPRPLHDELVGRVHHFHHVEVRHDARRYIVPGSQDPRMCHDDPLDLAGYDVAVPSRLSCQPSKCEHRNRMRLRSTRCDRSWRAGALQTSCSCQRGLPSLSHIRISASACKS